MVGEGGDRPPHASRALLLPLVFISAVSYRDALAGGHAPPAPFYGDASPRTPGGSHVPVTVSRNAAASAQHSPTILASGGVRADPWASPAHGGGGGMGGHHPSSAAAPRKISFDFLSQGSQPGKAAAEVGGAGVFGRGQRPRVGGKAGAGRRGGCLPPRVP